MHAESWLLSEFIPNCREPAGGIWLFGGFAGSISTTAFPITRRSQSIAMAFGFRQSDFFRHVFEAVVRACVDAGLVKGQGFAVDASVMEAGASRCRGVPPEEADWSAPGRRTRRSPSSWEQSTMTTPPPTASPRR